MYSRGAQSLFTDGAYPYLKSRKLSMTGSGEFRSRDILFGNFRQIKIPNSVMSLLHFLRSGDHCLNTFTIKCLFSFIDKH